MKRSLFLNLLMLTPLCGYAQLLNPTVKLDLEARIDFQREVVDGETLDDNSGFKGKYLNVKLTGQLTKHLSYAVLQRLNKTSYNSSFFDATDYAYLEYEIGERWSVAGGKQFVYIGGWEYDHAPINVYRGSEFWNNIPCHQMGVSATFRPDREGRNKFLAQICTSPFYDFEGSNNNTYAYNLMWMGNFGVWNTIYSANMIEYRPNHYISYFVSGNSFRLGRAVTLELDYMNRAASGQAFIGKDASVMANVTVDVNSRWQLFAKGTYDVNHRTEADYTVLPGTEIKQAGLGVEYRPLKEQRSTLRLHAFCFYAWGKNSNPSGALQDKQTIGDVGLTWYMNVAGPRK
jgi:hypothetical protein